MQEINTPTLVLPICPAIVTLILRMKPAAAAAETTQIYRESGASFS